MIYHVAVFILNLGGFTLPALALPYAGPRLRSDYGAVAGFGRQTRASLAVVIAQKQSRADRSQGAAMKTPASSRWPRVAVVLAGTRGADALIALVTLAASRLIARLDLKAGDTVTGVTLASFTILALPAG